MANVLIIEDDPNFRKLLAYSLEDAGHAPVGCRSFPKAEEALKENDFDIVVTDMILSRDGYKAGMNGLEIIWKVKDAASKGQKDIPIILISGAFPMFGRDTIFDVAKKIGAKGVLAKPFELDALVGMIDDILITDG